MPEIPEPEVRVTRYEVSSYPPDDINSHCFTLAVEYRGEGKWAVLNGRQALDASGDMDWEPIPSERDDEWLAAHRFDLDTALAIAKKAAPKMTVNGITVTEALARHTAREARRG